VASSRCLNNDVDVVYAQPVQLFDLKVSQWRVDLSPFAHHNAAAVAISRLADAGRLTARRPSSPRPAVPT
jgi:hypothetical protein